MPNFIHLPEFGYLDLDNVVQVFNPNGGDVDLDHAPEIAVRLAAPVYDGYSISNVAKVTGPSVELLIAALGLLKVPHSLEDLIIRLENQLKVLQPPFPPPPDSIGE
jgi:hypothetical protein